MTPYKSIPTYDHNLKTWDQTDFASVSDFRSYVLSLFKVPGTYEFDETALLFNAEAVRFNKDKYYCAAPFRSKDFIKYWDDQKLKCREGVIYKHNGKEWYLPRDYYMFINFLPIFDKEKRKFDFPNVWDSQYHLALYELLAELHYEQAAVLKKRQWGSSYFHMGKLINTYWFEEGAVLKMGSSLKDYINEKGSWKFLDEYRNFLNEHTAWYRNNEPNKVLSWMQKIQVRVNGRDKTQGLKSTITGVSFEKDPTNGVGGPVRYFFHEEAGIAPKMDTTLEFILPALKAGMITTGLFIAAGSVGDLDQCEPLKKMILDPKSSSIYAVWCDLIDKDGTAGWTGLFVPEQWSMRPYIDQFGNSIVYDPTPEQKIWLNKQWQADGSPTTWNPNIGALEAILLERIEWKRDLSPEKYQLRISQKPTNIEEAFAYRKESKFPQHLVSKQLQRIDDKTYPFEVLELQWDDVGKISAKETRKLPISEFPISPKTQDKEGALVVWERPQKDKDGTIPWGRYYASVDPVGEGKTTTSESLCSIIVYKNPITVIQKDQNGNMKTHIEHDKIVATWCGRFDDVNKTHKRLELIIEWFNAWTIVENNISIFIHYMMAQRKQKFLVPKDQIIFLKELRSNMSVYADYGWKNTGTLFKAHLLSYGIEFLQEVIDSEVAEDGTVTSSVFGIERIPDPMICKEMQAYQDGVNVDRLVAYCALIAFAKVQQAARGMQQRVEVENDKLEKPQNFSKLSISPFRHMGGHNSTKSTNSSPRRSAFRHIR